MVCLWLSVSSVVLGVGCAACACGLVAVVSSLGAGCRMCCLWLLIGGRGFCRSDGEPVACGGQFPRCCVSVSDGVPQFQR